MSWFTLSLLSVFALASAELLQQKLLSDDQPISPRSSAVITFLIQSLLTLPFLLLSSLRNQIFSIFHPDLLPQVLAVTTIASIAMIFYLKGFQVKNISLSSIFVSFSTVVSTTIGIIIFHESLTIPKILGITLILTAIISLNYRNSILEKNHFFGFLAGIMFGITYSFDKSIILSIHPLIYIFWAFFLVSIFGFLISPKEVIATLKNQNMTSYQPLLLSGFAYFVYNLMTFFSYKFGGEVGRVDAINNSQVFLIILYEFVILKHRSGFKRKIITAIFAFGGVVLLGNY